MAKSSRHKIEYPKPIPVDKPAIIRSVDQMTFEQAAIRFNDLSAMSAHTDTEAFEFKRIVLKDPRISLARYWHLRQINDWRPGLLDHEVKELSWLAATVGKPLIGWQKLDLGNADLGWQQGRSVEVGF